MPILDTRSCRAIYRFFILFFRESEHESKSRELKKKTCGNKKTAKNAKAAEVVDVDRLVFATVVALNWTFLTPAYVLISRLSEEEPCSQKQKEKTKKDQQAKKPAKSSQQTEVKKGDAMPYVVIIWLFSGSKQLS